MPQPNFYIHFPSINGEWIEPPAQDKKAVLKMIKNIKGVPVSLTRQIEKAYNSAPAGADIALIIDGSKHSIAYCHRQSNTLFPVPLGFL